MTEFECGCRIISDVINLNKNKDSNIYWGYTLKTFANVCGNCSKKQMKFQHTENKLITMEKQRMKWFLNFEDEDDEDDYEDEYKEQFRNMTDEEIERHIGLERVRNVMEGYDKEHGIKKIRRIVKEVRDEDKESIDSDLRQAMYQKNDTPVQSPKSEYHESEDSEFQRNIWIYKNNSD